jgi:hypothetical protein
MRVWPLVAARYGWIRGLTADAPRRPRAPRDVPPLRTLFNSYTQEYEEISLTELQLLLRQGRIQETTPPKRDGQPQRILRLV